MIRAVEGSRDNQAKSIGGVTVFGAGGVPEVPLIVQLRHGLDRLTLGQDGCHRCRAARRNAVMSTSAAGEALSTSRAVRRAGVAAVVCAPAHQFPRVRSCPPIVVEHCWPGRRSPRPRSSTTTTTPSSGTTGGRSARWPASTYRSHPDALVTALTSHTAIRECGPLRGIAAGLHVTVPLPPQADEHAVVERLGELRVAVMPLSRYAILRRPPALVVGYGRLSPPGPHGRRTGSPRSFTSVR